MAGRTYPISFWLENRHHEIRAVLDEFEGAEDDRRLIVLTDRGVFDLEGRATLSSAGRSVRLTTELTT